MAGESNVIDLAISVQDQVPKLPDIQTVLLVADVDGAWYGTKTFAADPDGITELVGEGVTPDFAAHKILSAFAAEGGISTLKIFSRTTPNAQEVELVPVITAKGYVHSITVNGVEVTHTNGAAESVNTICDALETLLNAIDGVVATPDNATATKLVLEPDTGFQRISFTGVSKGLTLKDISADGSLAGQLAAAMAEDSSWSILVLDSQSSAEIAAAATFAAANGRMLVALCIDNDVLTNSSTDTLSDLGSNQSTALIVTQDTETFGAFTGISSYLSYHPGAANLHMWSQFAFGSPFRAPSGTELGFADSKHAIVHTTVSDIAAFYGNRTPGGRVFTTQQFLNYLSSVMRTDVLALLLTSPKVPFTPEGIAMIEQVMRKRLKLEEDAGSLVPGSSTVTPKLYEDTTVSERGNGLLQTMKFSAKLAVSIDKVVIRGSLTI